MSRIGIVTCSNTTHDLACCSHLCLRDINEGRGKFAAYGENGGARLVGIVSCAGCPTAVGPGKILEKIRSLVQTGVDAIHFANCVATLCPFQNQFKKVIRENFPDTILVMGTHEAHDKDTAKAFRDTVGDMLCQSRSSLADVAGAMHYTQDETSAPVPKAVEESKRWSVVRRVLRVLVTFLAP